MPAILIPYSSTSTLYFALIGSATAAHSTLGSGSLLGTNVRVSKDGAVFATSTNTGTVVGNGFYSLVLTDTETSAKQIIVDIAGSGGSLGTLVEAQAFLLHTYGSASAMYVFWGAGSAGTPLVNLVANQSTATIGTVAFVATGTITQVGTVTFLSSGTVTTVINTVLANLTQVSGTAVTASGGRAEVNVSHWLGTVGAGSAGTPLVNLVANQSTATVGTVAFVATGTITTLINVASANVVQILGTAAVATGGTFTNVGTAGTALGTLNANIVSINGSATAAANLGRSAGVIASGSTTGTRTATSFETDLTQTGAGHWIGRVIIFIDGTMLFQASDVLAYTGSAVGTLGKITVTTLNATPALGASFVIL